MLEQSKEELAQVLVIDSEPHIRARLDELLKDLFLIHTSATGGRAIEYLEKFPIAVVVVDMRCLRPGLDLLAEISRLSPSTRVLLTGFDDHAPVSSAVQRGHIYAYLAKPWEPLELRVTITQAVEHYDLVRELNRERLLFQQLMEHSPDVIYFKDVRGRFTRVNQAKADLIGVADPQHLLGKGDWDFFSHEEAEAIRQEDNLVLEEGNSVLDQLHSFTPPDGILRWFSTTKVAVDEAAGGGLVGMSRDITQRKIAEDRLQLVVSQLVEVEKEKRDFCAQVVLSVTGGALHLVEYDEVPEVPNIGFQLSLDAPENYALVREKLRVMGTESGLTEEQVEDLILAAGEAATNAIKHAEDGVCVAGSEGGSVIVRVSDRGDGIHTEDLPDTLFTAGFSTQISLGLGYTLLLKLVDEMWLATGPEGTILQVAVRLPSVEDEEAALMALLERF